MQKQAKRAYMQVKMAPCQSSGGRRFESDRGLRVLEGQKPWFPGFLAVAVWFSPGHFVFKCLWHSNATVVGLNCLLRVRLALWPVVLLWRKRPWEAPVRPNSLKTH